MVNRINQSRYPDEVITGTLSPREQMNERRAAQIDSHTHTLLVAQSITGHTQINLWYPCNIQA